MFCTHLEINGIREIGKVPRDGHKLASPVGLVRHRLPDKHELRLATDCPMMLKDTVVTTVVRECRRKDLSDRGQDTHIKRGGKKGVSTS